MPTLHQPRGLELERSKKGKGRRKKKTNQSSYQAMDSRAPIVKWLRFIKKHWRRIRSSSQLRLLLAFKFLEPPWRKE